MIRAAQVVLHLQLQILEEVEGQVLVEMFLIVAMSAFHFVIVLGRFGPNSFVQDMFFSTEKIKKRIRFVFWLLQNSLPLSV